MVYISAGIHGRTHKMHGRAWREKDARVCARERTIVLLPQAAYKANKRPFYPPILLEPISNPESRPKQDRSNLGQLQQ